MRKRGISGPLSSGTDVNFWHWDTTTLVSCDGQLNTQSTSSDIFQVLRPKATHFIAAADGGRCLWGRLQVV